MKLGKTVAMVALVGTVAVSGAFAYGGGKGFGNCGGPGSGYGPGMMQGKQGYGPGMFQRGGMRGGGMMFLSGLDLTSDQQHQINILRDEMRLEMRKNMTPGERKTAIKEAFGANGFNKDAFLQNKQSRFSKMSALKANYMEKIYNILTPEQRKQLIENIDNFQPGQGYKQKMQ